MWTILKGILWVIVSFLTIAGFSLARNADTSAKAGVAFGVAIILLIFIGIQKFVEHRE